MATIALSPSRALHQPRRLDMRALLGLFLMLVAVGGSIAFWTTSSDTRSVLVATRDLPAGASLTAADLAIARVRLDDTIYQAALPATELSSLVGKQLAEPVHAQQVLVRPQLAARAALAPGQVAFTIAATPETAVGGKMQPGDTVQVLVTVNKGKPDARTAVVLTNARVYDVGYQQRAALVNTDGAQQRAPQGPVQWVTLAITQDEAKQLAQAKGAGDLDLALLPPRQEDGRNGAGSQPAG